MLVVPMCAGLGLSLYAGVALLKPRAELPAVDARATTPPGEEVRSHGARELAQRDRQGSSVSSRHRVPAIERVAPPLPTAAPFFLAELRRKLRGDWTGSWRHLHPFHQRIAQLDAFVRCETATPFPAPLESVRIVRVRNEPFRISGRPHVVQSAAVTVAVELQWYGPRDPISFEHTFHLVPVDGRWTWILSEERYRLYAQGGCPPDL